MAQQYLYEYIRLLGETSLTLYEQATKEYTTTLIEYSIFLLPLFLYSKKV